MKNLFLSILTDGEGFYSPELSTKEEAVARQVFFNARTEPGEKGFDVVAIPLATVMASPKLLTTLQECIIRACPPHVGTFEDAQTKLNMVVRLAESAISEATKGGEANLPRPSAETVLVTTPKE